MNFHPDILSWLCADAQNLPLEDNTYDLYTIAFGIRNVVDIPKVLRINRKTDKKLKHKINEFVLRRP